MKLILLFLGTYLGIMAALGALSIAFEDGGIWGVIGLVVWILFIRWAAKKICGDG